MAQKFVNLTPHEVKVYGNDVSAGPMLVVQSSGMVARVGVKYVLESTVDNISIYTQECGEIDGLPASTDGVFFIVSAMIRQQVGWRRDLLSPGELIRDEKGQPIGCKGLVSN